MVKDIDLGLLENGPHAKLIRDLADKCYADSTVEAVWVEEPGRWYRRFL